MSTLTVHTDLLFDSHLESFVSNRSIIVNTDSGLIEGYYVRDKELGEVKHPDIDLRGKICLPGLVDSHTHIFLHAYTEKPSVNQKRDESFVERIVRATDHCRTALLAGYTTYRDLGSEGMKEADVGIRDAINKGLIPGPRLYVATRPLASTNSYVPRTENLFGGTQIPPSCEACDGETEIRTVVRRRVALGTDVIKFFADYRRKIMRFPPLQQHPYIPGDLHPTPNPNPDVLVFTQKEMSVICEEARLADLPCVSHAGTKQGILDAVAAGVTSIEHGYHADEECFLAMHAKGCIFVPTLAICEKIHTNRFDEIMRQTKMAYDIGVKIACGGDTGTYSHGDNARELELMVEAGIPVEKVIKFATLGGWEACGSWQTDRSFGSFDVGAQADIIALSSDPRLSKDAFRQVEFVMKNASVYKQDGIALV